MPMSKNSGFTLLEMAVVMAILGLVAALTTPNLIDELNQRRANFTIEETQMVVDAARAYRIQRGVWPGDSTCSNAIQAMKSESPPYIVGIPNFNKYNSLYSTSCTLRSFSIDQNAVPDWDGYIANSLAGTEIVSAATSQIRTTVGIPGTEAALDAKLSRFASGNAELNRMRTTLLLGGNDISEVNKLNANHVNSGSGSFSGGVSTLELSVEQLVSIAGVLSVQGESQFTGKTRFKDEVVLQKQAIDGQVGCETGALARDATGATLSCQSGIWKSSVASTMSYYKFSMSGVGYQYYGLGKVENGQFWGDAWCTVNLYCGTTGYQFCGNSTGCVNSSGQYANNTGKVGLAAMPVYNVVKQPGW